MKFLEKWIKKKIKTNLNTKNIISILNNYGFETKTSKIKEIINTKKYKIKKIIKQKKISNYISYIITKNKKKKIYIKKISENITNKKIIIKNKTIKNKFLNIKKIQYGEKYIFLIYKKKKEIKKIKNYINKNNILEINIPNNRIDCNNINGISNQILKLIKKKKTKNKKKIIKKNKYKKNKYTLIFKNKKKINNYKYLIIKNINLKKIKKNKIIKKISKKKNINFNKKISKIFYLNLKKWGQKITYLDLDKIKKKNNNKKIIIIDKKKNNKQFNINKNTKNIILIAPLFKEKEILKKNFKNNKKNNNKYISNYDKKIQEKSLYDVSKNINLLFGGKITYIKTKIINKIKKKKILLKINKIKKTIGIKINKKKIIKILKNINCKIINKKKFILIIIPNHRKDLKNQDDIIEEIIKINGYKKIKEKSFYSKILIKNENNIIKNINKIKNILINIGYKETINFHFSNKKKEKIIQNKYKKIKINNPISKNYSILRTSLIPGLIDNLLYNIKRQQNKIKIFELGTCYTYNKKKIKQFKYISAIIYGYKEKNKWYNKKSNLFNFYDIKGDIEYIFKKQKNKNIIIKPSKNKILDKYQNADILIKKKKIGYIGMLNNKIQKKYSIKKNIFLFEIKLKYILNKKKIKIKKISKFTYNKRDITIIINKNILLYKIINKCLLINKKQIKKINIIKIYKNNKLEKEKKKNITLRIYIQDNKKTLNENNIEKIIKKCKHLLKKKFFAIIE